MLRFQTPPAQIEPCWKRCQISQFLTPVKIRGGVDEISGSNFLALTRTEPGVKIWRASSAPPLEKWVAKKRTPVKLKAVPTTWDCLTRKRGNCECIATWGSPTPRSLRFNSLPVPSSKSLSLSVTVLERFYCLYVTLRCDLELWPRDLDLHRVWTYDARSIRKVQRQGVKGQGHSVTWRISVKKSSHFVNG